MLSTGFAFAPGFLASTLPLPIYQLQIFSLNPKQFFSTKIYSHQIYVFQNIFVLICISMGCRFASAGKQISSGLTKVTVHFREIPSSLRFRGYEHAEWLCFIGYISNIRNMQPSNFNAIVKNQPSNFNATVRNRKGRTIVRACLEHNTR